MINFAIIGCGPRSKAFADILSDDTFLEGKLIALCDENIQQVEKFSEFYRVPSFHDFSLMMQEMNSVIDIVLVISHSLDKVQNILELVSFGKTLMIEAPLTYSLSEMDFILEALDLHNIKLLVVDPLRYQKGILFLYEKVEEGHLGKLLSSHINIILNQNAFMSLFDLNETIEWDKEIIFELLIPYLTLLSQIMGEIQSVFARSSKIGSLSGQFAENSVVTLNFKSGALATIHILYQKEIPQERTALFFQGENSSIQLEGTFQGGFYELKKDISMSETLNSSHDVGHISTTTTTSIGRRNYLEKFATQFNRKKCGLVEIYRSRKILEVILALQESLKKGREIFVRLPSLKND
jgi:predicted dehydrogenase